MAYETLESDVVFKGKIISVRHDKIKLPDGRSVMREIVARKPAAAVVPLDKDGNVILVRQYRQAAKALSLEIPAGVIEGKEGALVCATRELEEETGYVPGSMKKLTEMYASIGFSTEIITIFLATELTDGVQNLDDDEFIEIEKYTMSEAIEKIVSGEICDSKTIAGILAADNYLRSVGEK